MKDFGEVVAALYYGMFLFGFVAALLLGSVLFLALRYLT